ncbi:MAG: substrate-binding domain-containing protein [Deltaproteobacteria bacterium]|nr:substrate-binding domain-containing protein [Deltaproteobacteria bacterium]
MSTKRIGLMFGPVIGLLLFVCLASNALAEEVKVGAGAAPTENILDKIKDPMEKAIGLKLTVIANGPSQALKDLDKGAVDAAAGGLTFPDWMVMMDKEGYAIPDKGAYKSRVIGKDIVKVLTNKDTGVKSLTKEQLKGIFTGKIANWKEVNGADKPIVVILGSKIPGTQSVFQKQVLDGEPYTKNAREGTDADDLKTRVAATPGAVCLGPMSAVGGDTNAPDIPEVGRPITLITKGEPGGAVLKMLEYIRGEGQKYIAK